MSHTTSHPPELQVSEWLDTPEPPSLAALCGQVVVAPATARARLQRRSLRRNAAGAA